MLLNGKQIRLRSPGVVAIVIILLAIALRIVLTIIGWPPTNSDESTMGLMAIHIARARDFPIFLYGQPYMGAGESYIGAALMHIFGETLFAARLGNILLFTLSLISMYFLASLLYTKKVALITIGLLATGSIMMIFTELMVHGGYPELIALGTTAFLLATYLALSSNQDMPLYRQRKRLLAFGGWGLVCALGFWGDYIMLPIVLMSGLLIAIFCWRELLKGAVLPVLLGLLVGGIPLIIYNLHAPPGLSTLAVMWKLHSSFTNVVMRSPYNQYHLYYQVVGTLLDTLPLATGAPPLCFDASWVEYGRGNVLTHFGCLNPHGQWGLMIFSLCWSFGYLLLWSISILHELGRLRQIKRAAGKPGLSLQRQELARHFARFALLLCAALILLEFTLSPVAAVLSANSRYLIGLLIATPVMIAPLCGFARDRAALRLQADLRYEANNEEESLQPAGIGARAAGRLASFEQTARGSNLLLPAGSTVRTTRKLPPPGQPAKRNARNSFARMIPVLRWGGLLCISLTFLAGTISIFQEVPIAQAVEQQQQRIIADLARIHVTHFYTDYWTCQRLEFLSDDKLTCASLDGSLHESNTRVPGYYAIVKSDPWSAYMFPLDSVQAGLIARRLAQSHIFYQRYTFEGYVLYQPLNGITP